ncbi:hypothetical protein [Streptomyces sp. NPDC050759]|uniref:hypothetical protein n=1 Tax=Streptomyces sp. NPDC050759 TaxID=3365635 RepID=UPI0037A75236
MPEAPEIPEAPDTPEAPETPEESPRARRRGRTTLLIAGAAVLGVVAGTCTGYLIQADREPTKLASLSQPTLTQAKGPAPEPLSAAQDRRVKTDGDLRKLLLKKPAGAKDADWLGDEDGWLDLARYAELYEEPADAFSDQVSDEFRRVAVTGWASGDRQVTVRLIQYRQEEAVVAADQASSGQYWADKEGSTRSRAIPGTGDGMAYVHDKPDTEPGYLPVFGAEAYAWRGDVTMEIRVYDTKSITMKTIMDLAERQMERL